MRMVVSVLFQKQPACNCSPVVCPIKKHEFANEKAVSSFGLKAQKLTAFRRITHNESTFK